MNLIAMTLPEDPAELAEWLDRQLVGPDLTLLAAELAAVHGQPATDPPAVEDLLGPRWQAVLEGGLAEAAAGAAGQFLLHPGRLLELQERIFTEGGAYWDELDRTNPARDALADRGLNKVKALWDRERPGLTPTAHPDSRRPWYSRPWFVSLATAAVVLVGVGLAGRLLGVRVGSGQPEQAARVGWGWARPGALEGSGTAADYLRRVAKEAEEWSKKRPDQPTELARRIGEFREGCSALIFAPHEPLPEEGRKWLRDRCRVWAGKLDQQLTALEAGGDAQKVRGEVDLIVRQLVKALNEKAETM